MTAPARPSASTITDDELDQLHARLAAAEAAVGSVREFLDRCRTYQLTPQANYLLGELQARLDATVGVRR